MYVAASLRLALCDKDAVAYWRRYAFPPIIVMPARSARRVTQDLEELFSALFTVAVLLAGLGVLGWQVFGWLSSGEWTSVSLLDFLRWGAGPKTRAWIENPTTWIGWWRVLNWTPVSGILLLVGMVMLLELHIERWRKENLTR